FFIFIAPSTPNTYTLSLHDALPISFSGQFSRRKKSDFFRKTTSFDIVFEWFLAVVQLEGFTGPGDARLQAGYSPKIVAKSWSCGDRKSTRLNSSHVSISYAVFCLKK